MMKAAYIERLGDASRIQIGELPDPEVYQKDVLVRVEGVAVDRVDTYVRSGAYQTDMAFPHVIGRDMVGEVVSVGSAVTAFKVGDSVWTNSMGYDGRQGVTSTLVAVSSDRLAPVPRGVDHIQLIASVHSSATAVLVLSDVMQVRMGQSILIEGAAGHVGTKLVQLAERMGLDILTTSNERDFTNLAKLGSQGTFNYRENFGQKVTGLFSNGVDHIIDTSGNADFQTNINLLAQNGEITLITAPKSNLFSFNVRHFYMNQKHINGFVISHASIVQLRQAAQTINAAFRRGMLLDDEIIVKHFDDAQWAHETLEMSQDKGKRIVLVP